MKARGGASLLLLTSATFLVAVGAIVAPAPQAAEPVPVRINFSRDVLPILSDKCFKCHGPDAAGRQADMRLDTPQGAFVDRGGRWPIVPGKPKDSLVCQRIASVDSPMPPKYSGKSLSPREIAILTKWVAEGAQYSKLWSFEALPERVQVPTVKSSWARNDIDRFILSRLRQANLSPSPVASRERLLRRVTLDLTGLPPTPAELAAFLADRSPKAYDKVVDRLLASPHYGERIAVDWLDAARYSDSYGYQSDVISPTWPYRDWVVKAFNENLPYDQFLTDNLAGDLLKNPSSEQRLATAFNRLHRQSNEGGSIAQEYLTEYAVDRVSTFGTAMLGLTLGCARCHDHKFDPITQREFYQLYGYFNSINEYGLLLSTEIVPSPSMLLPTPEQATELTDLRAQDVTAKANLAATSEQSAAKVANWLASKPTPKIPDITGHFTLDVQQGGKYPSDAGGKGEIVPIGPVETCSGHAGAGVRLDGDNGLRVSGVGGRERWDAFSWSFWVRDPRVKGPVVLLQRTGGTDVGFCGFDLMLENGYLTARVMRAWPGNAIAVRTKSQVPADQWAHIGWSYDGSAQAAGLKLYINGVPVRTETLNDKLWKKVNAYGDLGGSGGDWAFGMRFRDAGFKGGEIDEVTVASRALSPLEFEQLFDGAAFGKAMIAPSGALSAYYAAAIDPDVARAREAVRQAETNLANYEEGIYEIEVMEETAKPVPAYLLARGRYDAPRNSKTLVGRDVPKSLPPLLSQGRNDRLTLAKWLTRPNHPLTARVAVNRLWQMIFGVGLVETSENFGVQGSRPTHPELLDFLARRFVDSGWNVKSLIKLMVCSSTYMQDSALTSALAKADPLNKLFARGPSGRMSAEMIRDTALAASGLLNDKIGGAPVNPYQPAGIWSENNTMSPGFVQSKGSDLYRRSLYSTWKRTTPVPSMLMFDATSREACTVRRPATNTPLQALVLLNDVQFVEAARALADQALRTSGSDSQRIAMAFERLAGRKPDLQESSILLSTLREQRAMYKADPKLATKLIAVGDSKPSAGFDAVELAAMTVTVQTILNSDVTIWKR